MDRVYIECDAVFTKYRRDKNATDALHAYSKALTTLRHTVAAPPLVASARILYNLSVLYLNLNELLKSERCAAGKQFDSRYKV